MRPLLVGACLGLLVLSSGCGPFVNNKGGGTVADTTPRWGGTPKPEQLVATLNQNSQMLTSLEAKKVFMTARQNNEHVGGLEGFLACQKAGRPGTPPNFRLQADLLGTPRVDVGSNSDEFWFFIKDPARPYVVYYCSYADYPKVAARGAMPFPVQPEWVVEALGMAEYDPHQKYEVNDKNKDTYDLIQRTRSARGTRCGAWVMMSRVRSPKCSSMSACMARAAPASRLLVASSSTSTTGSLKSARAIASRCRWPVERPVPPLPTSVSYPAGSCPTKASTPARRAAACTASSEAPKFP